MLQRAGDRGRRLVLVALAIYGGGLAGQVCHSDGVNLRVLSPLAALFSVLGCIMTPGMNVLLAVMALLSAGYVWLKVPLWTCGVLLLGFAGVAWGTLSLWITR
jgi:hypothetical protein